VRLVYTENLHALPLPAGHKFPIRKYDVLYRTLASEMPDAMQLGGRASWQDVTLVHDPAYAAAVRDGTLPAHAIRRLGFPWSEALVTRSLRSVGGTLAALAWAISDGAAGHIAGGTHHAFRDRGEGFCVFNDLAVAIAVARRDYGVRRIAVVDLDVHQGNGTASIFAGDDDVLTLSLHAAHNYPFHKESSSIDVPLPDGCDDATYLRALDAALERVRAHRPELVLYQAGVDGLFGDRLGRMALSLDGLSARDARVFAFAKRIGAPIVATLGGGYHRDIDASVAAHANVYRAMARAFATCSA
jgi:acetoin utilization deacetylase AcuC-like enzyme